MLFGRLPRAIEVSTSEEIVIRSNGDDSIIVVNVNALDPSSLVRGLDPWIFGKILQLPRPDFIVHSFCYNIEENRLGTGERCREKKKDREVREYAILPIPKMVPSLVTATPFNDPLSFGALTHGSSKLSRK